MRSYKKGFLMVISILLCSILITSSVVSSTFAKYTTSGSGSSSARVSKWGITVSSDTELADTYYNENGVMTVNSKGKLLEEDGIIAPGTSGVLASITIVGNPEVAYAIDFSGTLTIGEGYKKSSGLIRSTPSNPIDYFPIALYIYEIDHNNGNAKIKKAWASHARKDGSNMLYLWNSTDGGAWNLDIDNFAKMFSSEFVYDGGYKYLDTDIDSMNNAPNTPINKTFTVEWEWQYQADASNTYQTTELDTQLGEAMQKHSDKFGIGLDFSVTVSQID